ncbi:MAG: hypothetical protein V3U79_00720 [Dehalococcoidia bacterium]
MSDNLMLFVVVNPLALDSAEDYVSQLRGTGFIEEERSQVNKGLWKGLRLEGKSTSLGISFDQAVYIVKSNNSLLSLSIVMDPPLNQTLADTVWGSLSLNLDRFPLSPSLLVPEGFTTLVIPEGSFSISHPLGWQVAHFGEGHVNIFDFEDRETFVFTILPLERKGMGVDGGIELLLSILSSFSDVVIESRSPIDVVGADSAVQLAGSFKFESGASGDFRAIVAVSPSNLYIVNVPFKASKAESLVPLFEKMLGTFKIVEP